MSFVLVTPGKQTNKQRNKQKNPTTTTTKMLYLKQVFLLCVFSFNDVKQTSNRMTQ